MSNKISDYIWPKSVCPRFPDSQSNHLEIAPHILFFCRTGYLFWFWLILLWRYFISSSPLFPWLWVNIRRFIPSLSFLLFLFVCESYHMTPKSKANDADAARLWTGFLLFSTHILYVSNTIVFVIFVIHTLSYSVKCVKLRSIVRFTQAINVMWAFYFPYTNTLT